VEYVVTDVGRKWRYQLISVCMMFATGPCSVLLQNTIFSQALKKSGLMSIKLFCASVKLDLLPQTLLITALYFIILCSSAYYYFVHTPDDIYVI
jgi:hypothetical protein